VAVTVTTPIAETFVSTRGEGPMRRDQAAGMLHYDGDQLLPQPSLELRVRAGIPVQPTHAMANVRTTLRLIAGLLLAWGAIVAM
jgi:hypothetical protein